MRKIIEKRMAPFILVFFAALAFMGPRECGEGVQRWFSTNPAPDVRGDWEVTYDNSISVEVDIGGQLYSGSITGDSGVLTFTHNGQDVTLNLDCSRAWVVCPSEIFASRVTLEQRNFQDRPHQVHMTVNSTECLGSTRLPDEADGECDSSDPKRPCDVEICDNVGEASKTTIGTISDPGSTTQRHPPFDIELLLGGDFAVPTPNCVLLSWSVATADLQYTGNYDVDDTEPTMDAHGFTSGEITTGYGGACFWFEETGYSEDLKAALLAATIRFRTGFTAQKLTR